MAKLKDITTEQVKDMLYAKLEKVESAVEIRPEYVGKYAQDFFEVFFTMCGYVMNKSDERKYDLDVPMEYEFDFSKRRYNTITSVGHENYCDIFVYAVRADNGRTECINIICLDPETIAILCRRIYLEMTDENYNNHRCPRCGRPMELSQIVGYSYQCHECDEDFFMCELKD